MKKKKIRVLLAGYVNNINAQDLNCRSLAMFLDKDKFDVSAFLVPYEFRDFEIGEEMSAVNLIQLHRPARLLWYWIYLKGIFNCDIAYLPKGQKWKWCKFLCKVFGKRSMITVEALISPNVNNPKTVRDKYNACSKTYSITRYMQGRNYENLSIRPDGVLYLGVDSDKFRVQDRKFKVPGDRLDVIFIGTDIKRKKLDEFLELAKMFPNVNFHVVSGCDRSELDDFIGLNHGSNVIVHGKLSHDELSQLLRKVDLHVLPSKAEGFPKVTLETASAGVPSIVYGDYGASEWITSGKDGFVVDSFKDIVDIIKNLQANPENLKDLSANAIELGSRFDWKAVVKDWEEAIEDLYNSSK